MTEVRAEELSALLDNELDSARAGQVRAAIDADPLLLREFEVLARLDVRLRGAAEEAAFTPGMSFPTAARELSVWRWPAGMALVLALVGARLLPKLVELPLAGIALQLFGCAAIALAVLAMARETGPLAGPTFGKGIRA